MDAFALLDRRAGERAALPSRFVIQLLKRIAVLAVLAVLAVPAGASAFDPGLEAKNFAKILERNQHIVYTPEFQARLLEQDVQDTVDQGQILTDELEVDSADRRLFLPANLCGQRKQQCAGDVRFYDWAGTAGIREPLLFTTRSGATISGHVWRTAGGPAKRPGIVITTGSVQAPETLYWGFAATLAKAGYVVLTYDVQGQGRSDTYGEGDDEQEGVPFQQPANFVDGAENSLDFFLSTPSDPFEPQASCGTDTSHADKHQRRVDAGLNAAFNPFWEYVDQERIGVAGQSLGAAAVSYYGQVDQRVDAIVAWDNLRGAGESPSECASSPRPDSTITKPALGVSNDYGITQTPFTADPDPEGKTAAFQDYKATSVDSMQVNVRGGTHFEAAFIPGSFTPVPLGSATLRGYDLASWYTTAWFDKYVRCPGEADPAACEADADERLLSDRWRDDAPGKAVDANSDANVFSFYFRSRFDFVDAGGSERICDDMRSGCPTMGPDSKPMPFSIVADAYRADPDPGPGPGQTSPPCALPQRGSDRADSPRTLVPTEAGDAIRGGRGPDRLQGRGGRDCLYGQRGRDKLNGGADSDRLFGGRGGDVIRAVDGSADRVSCGRGRDRAVVDQRDRTGRFCERVRRVRH